MKKSKEIIGAPVISISEGLQIGTVKGLVISPLQRKVDFLLLDEINSEFVLRGLPFLSAEAFGEFAITVQDKNEIIDLMKISIIQDLIQKDIVLIGTNIVTNKGKLLGEVVEFSANTLNGELTEVYYNNTAGKENSLPASMIITIGKEVLVVEDGDGTDVISSAKDETGNFKKGDDRSAGTVKSAAAESETAKIDAETIVEAVTETNTEAETIDETQTEPQAETEGDILISEPEGDLDPAEIFVRRQQQYLIGKTLFKDIKKDDGEVIAWENEIITEELFERVYSLGTQKLMELAMSVRE